MHLSHTSGIYPELELQPFPLAAWALRPSVVLIDLTQPFTLGFDDAAAVPQPTFRMIVVQ